MSDHHDNNNTVDDHDDNVTTTEEEEEEELGAVSAAGGDESQAVAPPEQNTMIDDNNNGGGGGGDNVVSQSEEDSTTETTAATAVAVEVDNAIELKAESINGEGEDEEEPPEQFQVQATEEVEQEESEEQVEAAEEEEEEQEESEEQKEEVSFEQEELEETAEAAEEEEEASEEAEIDEKKIHKENTSDQERDQSIIMESTEVQTAAAGRNDSEMEVTRDVAENQEQQHQEQHQEEEETTGDEQQQQIDSNGSKTDEQQQLPPSSIKRDSTQLPTIRTVTSNDRHSPDLNRQSVDVGGGVRRRACDPSALIIRRFEDIPTAYHSFRRAAERFGNNPCLGKREKLPNGNAGPYRWLTYAEVKAKASNIAAGFKHIGVPNFGHIGIFSINCVEWQITSIAANMQSLCTISLYDTLGPESSLYITNHGEIHTLFRTQYAGQCGGARFQGRAFEECCHFRQ